MYIKSARNGRKPIGMKLALGLPLVFLLIFISVFSTCGALEIQGSALSDHTSESSVDLPYNHAAEGDTDNPGDSWAVPSITMTSPSAISFSSSPKELTNVIDKVRFAASDNAYHGEWTADYGDNGEFISDSTAKGGMFPSGARFTMELDWSTKGEMLSEGDYFTMFIPKGFIATEYLPSSREGELHEDANDNNTPIIAGYKVELISDDKHSESDMLITITFTDFVNNVDKIAGNFWLTCYTASFEGADHEGETRTVEFEINNDGRPQTHSLDVTVLPPPVTATWEPGAYNYSKYGSCSPAYIIDGYYYFYWDMYINMDFSTNTPVVDNFKIEDVIPKDSPHKFITPADNAAFGSQKNLHRIRIQEYIGADDATYDTPEKRYTKFKDDYNADGSENWVNKIFKWNGNSGYFLPDSENVQELAGIDGGMGINPTGFANPVSDADYISADGKTLFIDLGRVTRPTIISYYTIAEKELSENALGSSSTVSAFINNVRYYGENEGADFGEKTARVLEYSFVAGGGGTGLPYDKEFSFMKTDDVGNPLQGARFILYENENCTGIAQAMAVSDVTGRVRFTGLREGIYYLKEDIAPTGFALIGKVYMVNLSESGTEIFQGDEFSELLIKPVRIQNSVLKNEGYLLIKKISATTGDSLEGAVFEIYDGYSLIKTVTLGGDGTVDWSTINPTEDGYWLISGLESGKEYRIKETVPPNGYLLNETEEENTKMAYASDSLIPEAVAKAIFNNFTPDEAPFTSRLKIIKYDNNGNLLKGATFEIYTKEEPKTLVATADMSDTDTWVSDWLSRGEYSVFETISPEGTNEVLPKNIGDVELKGKIEETLVLTVVNNLVIPEQPSEPDEPTVTPEQPSEPDKPTVTPEQPPEPDKPAVKPEQPSEPDKPTVTPEQPPEPDKPTVKPEQPSDPDKPTVKPEQPSEPDKPTVKPDQPLEPEAPILTPEPTSEQEQATLIPEPSTEQVQNPEDCSPPFEETNGLDLPDDSLDQKENPRTGDKTPYLSYWELLITFTIVITTALTYHLRVRNKIN